MTTYESDTIEYWQDLRDWLEARIPTQTNPETIEELQGALAVTEREIARLSGTPTS